MFRRIELITKIGKHDFKTGLMGISTLEVCDAWIDWLGSPRKRIHKNCRFYFTERGWDEIGRKVIAACIASGQEYRVLRVKERLVDVVYRDEHQVAVRPRRKRD